MCIVKIFNNTYSHSNQNKEEKYDAVSRKKCLNKTWVETMEKTMKMFQYIKGKVDLICI